MKTYTEKLNTILDEGLNKIKKLILKKGEESKHNNEMCLKITDNYHNINLDGDRYLTEINSDNLIDNHGYQYQHNVLSTDDLLSVIDYLIAKYK
jgi:hypothetical protein